jgi:hypothetical protein
MLDLQSLEQIRCMFVCLSQQAQGKDGDSVVAPGFIDGDEKHLSVLMPDF